MDDNVGLFYVVDGRVKDSADPGPAGMEGHKVVYEVVRVVDGVLLFYSDHFSRMVHSFNAIGMHLNITAGTLGEYARILLKVNGCRSCNIKIAVFEAESRQKCLLYISKSHYPSRDEIMVGVPAGLLRIERRDPNIKLLNNAYREAVSARIREGGYYEVLLVNDEGFITEGSKSNVFFIKGNKIFTAPGAYVLKGVTRKYVIEACRTAGFEVVEAFTGAAGLGTVDGVTGLEAVDGVAGHETVDGIFLSGTSIKVLPVSVVEDRLYSSSSNPVILKVIDEFDKLVEKYIENVVNIW